MQTNGSHPKALEHVIVSEKVSDDGLPTNLD